MLRNAIKKCHKNASCKEMGLELPFKSCRDCRYNWEHIMLRFIALFCLMSTVKMFMRFSRRISCYLLICFTFRNF